MHTNSGGLIKLPRIKLRWKAALLDGYLHVLRFFNVLLSIFFLFFSAKSISRPTELKQCRNCLGVNSGWITVLQLF